MGQKVNPHGIRVGVIKDWDSRWFASKKDFSDNLVEDHKIRTELKAQLKDAGVPKIEIERTVDPSTSAPRVTVNIYCAKPGMVIGKGGEERVALQNKLTKEYGKTVIVNVIEVKSASTNAQLVAEDIARQLENRVTFRRAMKQCMRNAMSPRDRSTVPAKGIKAMCSGRLGGADIARTESYHEGTIPLQTVNGVTIAYLSYTDHTNGIPQSSAMTANVIYTSQRDVMEQQVRRARELADFVVVGVHWGVEDSHKITQTQRDLAQQLSDWGADVILGTHPHVVQDAEWKTSVDGRQTFVAYSLGNFLSTQSKPDQLIGAILTLELNKTTDPDGSVHCAVASPQLHPTVTHYDAGKSNVRTYLFRDYTSELAQAHGVRAAYPNFGIEYIQNVLQTNINSAFLALA